jgi:hypothetical protein
VTLSIDTEAQVNNARRALGVRRIADLLGLDVNATDENQISPIEIGSGCLGYIFIDKPD